MTYTIVPMTYDHIPQVAAIERQCFPDPWSERMLREHLDNQCAAALVALGEDGTILGYAGLLVVLDEGYITNVATRPEYRRQGIASDLLGVFRNFAEGNHLAFLGPGLQHRGPGPLREGGVRPGGLPEKLLRPSQRGCHHHDTGVFL